MDIYFYTIDFSDFRILPASGKDIGYTSMNAVVDFKENGSFQLVFRDDELISFVKAHQEGLFVRWGNFEGYFTDYQFTSLQKTIFGSHLNALLHKEIVAPRKITSENLDEVLAEILPNWIVYDSGYFADTVIEFSTDKCKYTDEFVREYLDKGKKGYQVYIDGTELHFKVLDSEVNPTILSIGNKNVYEIQEDFTNKTVAFGGWYKKTQEDDGTRLDVEEWTQIPSTETGVYTQNVILNANSPEAASNELASYKYEHSHICKTRNIEYITDYLLGDVVRLQTDDKIINKQITSVDMWFEGSSYHEEPILSEWEE